MATTGPFQNATPSTGGQLCFICGSRDSDCVEDYYHWKKVKVCRAQCIIGRDIPVCRANFYWEVGRVVEFDVNSSRHCISFFDGTEWLKVDPTPMATYLQLSNEQTSTEKMSKEQQPMPEYQFKTLNMTPSSLTQSTPRQTLPLSPPEQNRPSGSGSLLSAFLNTQTSWSKDGNNQASSLPFAASFDEATSAGPLPSPLKNIFGPTASPPGNDQPNGYEDILAVGSPLKSPQEYGEVELNPRFSNQIEAAAAAAAAKAILSPRKTKKSPNKKKKKRKTTDTSSQRKTTIPRLWTNEEDQLLNKVVTESDTPLKWPDVARSIPERSGKQCRERYLNHLAPGVNHREFSPEEDALIFRLHSIYGSKWTKIASYLRRSDNSCKNRYALIVRRMTKDASKGLRCSLDEFKNLVMLDRIRSKPTASETVRSGKDSATRSILPYLASVSVHRKGPQSNVSMYDFGPFRPALLSGEQCRRCHLFAPSTHCGNAVCTITGWCEACCNVPAYVSGDLLRECLHLRKCQDEDKAAIQIESGLP